MRSYDRGDFATNASIFGLAMLLGRSCDSVAAALMSTQAWFFGELL